MNDLTNNTTDKPIESNTTEAQIEQVRQDCIVVNNNVYKLRKRAGGGGKRKGAGRPVGSVNKSTLYIKEILDKSVDFAEIARKMYELAIGLGGKPPDPVAARLLFEYRFGKPHQSMDITANFNISQTNFTKLSVEELSQLVREPEKLLISTQN